MTHLHNEVALTLKLEGEAFTSWDGIAEEITNRIADLFISDHKLNLRQRVQDLINDRVSAIVQERIETFLSKPIRPVDRFGDAIPDAEPKTLADMLAEAADAAMTQTVDPHSGKPEKRTPYNGAVPRLEWLLKRVAAEGIATAVEKAVRQVNADAKTAVQQQVAREIAARLAGGRA